MIKEGIHINAIYQHWKGDYYRIINVGYLEIDSSPQVIYHKCDINGIYISLRINSISSKEMIIGQPFIRPVNTFLTEVRHPQTQEFIKRYKFIKEL